MSEQEFGPILYPPEDPERPEKPNKLEPVEEVEPEVPVVYESKDVPTAVGAEQPKSEKPKNGRRKKEE